MNIGYEHITFEGGRLLVCNPFALSLRSVGETPCNVHPHPGEVQTLLTKLCRVACSKEGLQFQTHAI